jgi:hypothetical protein
MSLQVPLCLAAEEVMCAVKPFPLVQLEVHAQTESWWNGRHGLGEGPNGSATVSTALTSYPRTPQASTRSASPMNQVGNLDSWSCSVDREDSLYSQVPSDGGRKMFEPRPSRLRIVSWAGSPKVHYHGRGMASHLLEAGMCRTFNFLLHYSGHAS